MVYPCWIDSVLIRDDHPSLLHYGEFQYRR